MKLVKWLTAAAILAGISVGTEANAQVEIDANGRGTLSKTTPGGGGAATFSATGFGSGSEYRVGINNSGGNQIESRAFFDFNINMGTLAGSGGSLEDLWVTDVDFSFFNENASPLDAQIHMLSGSTSEERFNSVPFDGGIAPTTIAGSSATLFGLGTSVEDSLNDGIANGSMVNLDFGITGNGLTILLSGGSDASSRTFLSLTTTGNRGPTGLVFNEDAATFDFFNTVTLTADAADLDIADFGDALSYSWDIGNGTVTGTGESFTLTEAQRNALGFGELDVELTVTDVHGSTQTVSGTVIAAVPEPSSLALGLIGLAALGLRRRRS